MSIDSVWWYSDCNLEQKKLLAIVSDMGGY